VLWLSGQKNGKVHTAVIIADIKKVRVYTQDRQNFARNEMPSAMGEANGLQILASQQLITYNPVSQLLYYTSVSAV
jgi:hypothetical protein